MSSYSEIWHSIILELSTSRGLANQTVFIKHCHDGNKLTGIYYFYLWYSMCAMEQIAPVLTVGHFSESKCLIFVTIYH
jgi:hypothetical protein